MNPNFNNRHLLVPRTNLSQNSGMRYHLDVYDRWRPDLPVRQYSYPSQDSLAVGMEHLSEVLPGGVVGAQPTVDIKPWDPLMAGRISEEVAELREAIESIDLPLVDSDYYAVELF